MNLIESLVSAEFIRAFAWTLFHSLWQGGLIALLAAGLMMILRKHRPGIRYAVLYSLMLLLPVFFTGTFLTVYHPENTGIDPGKGNSGFLWQPENSLVQNFQSIPVTEMPRAWYAYLVHLFENQAKWLVLLWFTGFIIFLIRFSGSFLYVYRLKNYQVCQVDDRWKTNLRHLSGKLGMHRTVKLTESGLARIPMTIGYLKPVILLPLGTLSGVPPQQIDAILLHELAHILRKDYLLNIIQSVVELLFFYHPVTWWLSGQIRQEREHICDDMAVAVNQDHINYIKALATMEELNSKSPLLASALTGSKKKLLFRIKRLLSPVKFSKGLSEGIIAFILIAGLIFALSLNALSFIPNAYDLTGRESGEKVYSLLPLPNNIMPEEAAVISKTSGEDEILPVAEIPDTIVARSKSGKVVISVYTDSTSELQQEQLNRIAESMDRQAQNTHDAMKEYEVRVERFNNDHFSPYPGHHFEYKYVHPGCPDTSDYFGYNYLYSIPDLPDLENLDHQYFSFRSDSLDTLIFIGPEGHTLFSSKDLELSAEELQEHMREMGQDMKRQQRDMEKQQRDMERTYRNQHGNMGSPEPDPFFYNIPQVPPAEHRWNDNSPGPLMAPSEKIIRQELIDDGLASPHKKYVIDVNSKGMYINGEKQSKEIFRKYKHLVESLELADFEGEGTYRLIF